MPIGKDSVAWEAAYGRGAGRYVNSDGPPTPDAFLGFDQGDFATPDTEGGRNLKTIASYLFAANYTHFWTDTLRSNVAGSYWHQDNKDAVNFGNASCIGTNANALYTRAYTLHANLIWSPVPQTNFGVEYMRMQGRLQNGRTGDLNRIQASAQFKF